MPIYKPTELRDFLTSLGIVPKKGLSQNFLIDGNIIRKIVQSAKLTPTDVVLEIGPGPGSLTEALLDSGAQVVAVEKDRVLAQALERLNTPGRRLKVICEDILNVPLQEVLAPYLAPGQRAKVIANLPYHLTTPILVKLVQMHPLFSDLFLMVQEEVARRFTAQPATSEYSSFTIFLNFYSQPHYLFSVSHHCFYPEPNVESAIVSLKLQEPPHIANPEQFFILTRTAFSKRRKMLRASLRDLYPPETITKTLIQLNLNPQARPEDLSLETWLLLFRSL